MYEVWMMLDRMQGCFGYNNIAVKSLQTIDLLRNCGLKKTDDSIAADRTARVLCYLIQCINIERIRTTSNSRMLRFVVPSKRNKTLSILVDIYFVVKFQPCLH